MEFSPSSLPCCCPETPAERCIHCIHCCDCPKVARIKPRDKPEKLQLPKSMRIQQNALNPTPIKKPQNVLKPSPIKKPQNASTPTKNKPEPSKAIPSSDVKKIKEGDALATSKDENASAKESASSSSEKACVCCCKAPCLLVSSLLKRLDDTGTALEKKRLTCVIFHDLCAMIGAEPHNLDDEKRCEALDVAEKLGGWVEDLLERKGTMTCDNIQIDLKGVETFKDLVDCHCQNLGKK